jgi:hypothetical protein
LIQIEVHGGNLKRILKEVLLILPIIRRGGIMIKKRGSSFEKWRSSY